MSGRLFAAWLLLPSMQNFEQQAADSPQTRCVLEGTAVDFATGEPLSKATTRLLPSTGGAPGQMAITDGSGHFHLQDIPEGEYELNGERAGYLRSAFGARQPGGSGTALRLKSGDKLTGLILKLVRCPIFTGKVSDENGEPISKTLVYAVWREWFRGQPQYSRSEGAWTDDAGEYRIIDLRPGRYYLCAEVSSESFVEKQGGQEKRIVWSFYPGSRSLDGAQTLELQAGQDLRGVNFQLRAEPVFHIRGKLAGKVARESGSGLALSADPHGLGDAIVGLDSEMKQDGSFDFSGVPPGSYEIELTNEEYKQTIARTSVEVKKSDVNGLVLAVPSRFDVKGVVRRLDRGDGFAHLYVFTRDFDSPAMSHPYGAEVESDGSFKIENVWPGRYVFGIEREGAGDYIKSVQYGGREILGEPVELANGPGQIEILLSGGAGRVDGSIQSADSSVSVGGLEVVLASEAQRADQKGVLLANTDQNGHFSFLNVPPGDFYAFAVADVDLGLLENRDFVRQFRENGLEIEVPENANLQIRVPIMPAEDVQRALSALGL